MKEIRTKDAAEKQQRERRNRIRLPQVRNVRVRSFETRNDTGPDMEMTPVAYAEKKTETAVRSVVKISRRGFLKGLHKVVSSAAVRRKAVSLLLPVSGAVVSLLIVLLCLVSVLSIYGDTSSASDSSIVTVARSQLGQKGGEPYWSWYGFSEHVDWCACFVSWCAQQCGDLETGKLPSFSGCVRGAEWFRERGQWLSGEAVPSSGMIIFFDWDNRSGSGPQNGTADHVGIVESVDSNWVYTIEGNSGDECRRRQYKMGDREILGYGYRLDSELEDTTNHG